MPKVLVLNGPNVGIVGLREPHLYGNVPLGVAMDRLHARAETAGVEVEVVTSNHEGVLVDRIHEVVRAQGDSDVRAFIVNPGGATAYSVALLDALAAADRPVVEVHISQRFRKNSDQVRFGFDLERDLLAALAVGQVVGLGVQGYEFALEWLLTNVLTDD